MVSVCMATYNGERYIRQQVDSILSQLTPEDELLIGDDGSSDSTLTILESYKDPRIKIYRNNLHNYNLNFEKILSKAKGDHIFLSDQDDVWLPTKVSTMLGYLKDYDLLCSNCYITDAALKHNGDRYFTTDPSGRKGFVRNFIRNRYVGCCMAFNRKILDLGLPFPKGLKAHDAWFGLIAELKGKPKFISEPLILFRRHGNNTSSTCQKSTLTLGEKIDYRFTMLKGLIRILL